MALKPNIQIHGKYNTSGLEKPYILAWWKEEDSIFYPRLCIPAYLFEGKGECRIYPSGENENFMVINNVESGNIREFRDYLGGNELPHLHLEDAINIFDGDGLFVYGAKVADFLIVLSSDHRPHAPEYLPR